MSLASSTRCRQCPFNLFSKNFMSIQCIPLKCGREGVEKYTNEDILSYATISFSIFIFLPSPPFCL